jgi:hypothetical protein
MAVSMMLTSCGKSAGLSNRSKRADNPPPPSASAFKGNLLQITDGKNSIIQPLTGFINEYKKAIALTAFAAVIVVGAFFAIKWIINKKSEPPKVSEPPEAKGQPQTPELEKQPEPSKKIEPPETTEHRKRYRHIKKYTPKKSEPPKRLEPHSLLPTKSSGLPPKTPEPPEAKGQPRTSEPPRMINVRQGLGRIDYEVVYLSCPVHFLSRVVNSSVANSLEKECAFAELERRKLVPFSIPDGVDQKNLLTYSEYTNEILESYFDGSSPALQQTINFIFECRKKIE